VNEFCVNGECKAFCGQPPPGAALDGTFAACVDNDGTIYCGCNGCSEVCPVAAGFGCCHCGCKYIVTTCADACGGQ